MGRPDNRSCTYKGDRRGIVADAQLMGPDVDGVVWRPVREYFEDGKTRVIYEPVHPTELPAGMFR
ncbi:hypothetical protein CG716_09795 [Mycolicibacterium sphagni]|uniref:Uncharacterized protein n=2 Tax=Mycolicibacterium sphagni TaxID=1786 RepID=A0A255DMD6_9MYCO|nr:hypothetical protein CG716_09795 [Mycolicibacterium sphagni]